MTKGSKVTFKVMDVHLSGVVSSEVPDPELTVKLDKDSITALFKRGLMAPDIKIPMSKLKEIE